MRVLHLVSKKNWSTKMSSVRRLSMIAIGNHEDVELKVTGPGFDGFKGAHKSEVEFKPDIVTWYKPLDIPGHLSVVAPKCLRFNEMWAREATLKEIIQSKTDIVICHHGQEQSIYQKLLPGKKVVHIPHCAEKTIFKDYGLKKDIDVLYTGIASKKFYPLRRKFLEKVQPILKKRGYSFQIFKHPGYRLPSLEAIKKHTIKYARAMNRSKIVVTCSSKYKYELAKYAEIPMCRTALCADVPGHNQEWFGKWMIVVGQETPAPKIAERIIGYLKDQQSLQMKTDLGWQENLKCRTQEYYAEQFVKVVKECI